MSKLCKVLGIIILMHISVLNAQSVNGSKLEKNVPAYIVEKFNQKFPSQDPVWFFRFQGRYDDKLVYEAKFMLDNRYSMAVYDINATLLAFAATIDKSELPTQATAYMAEHYPNFPIIETLLVTRGDNDITYEVGIYIDNQYVIQVFSKTGDFIKSTKA